MKKRITKIICAAVAAVAAFGTVFATACSGSGKLDGDYSGDVVSSTNGGFAVEKGGYVYFVNGVGDRTANNSTGKPVKGAIYRIAKNDFAARNYLKAERVVGQTAYSADKTSGIFVYGDYVYYTTPSTAKNSDGETLNGNLVLKATKLDGSETKQFTQFISQDSNAYDYRFTEVDGTVYALYVAKSESLYEEETGVTNLHSYNTATGTDTLLAYNVDTVKFDEQNKTNPRVYYTMNVQDFDNDKAYGGYNQLYTVRADATQAKEYDFSSFIKFDEEKDRYINCGDLVLDGIGGKSAVKTPVNYKPEDKAAVNAFNYTYTLSKYASGTLFYTRKTQSSGDNLYMFADADIGKADPITANAEDGSILIDASNAANYEYVFKDGKFVGVLLAEADGGITMNKFVNGALQPKNKLSAASDSNYYFIMKGSSATLLFTDGDFLYYKVSDIVNRVKYTGVADDYEGMPASDDVTDDFKPVALLNVNPVADWYEPAIIDGQLLFASNTDNMNSFNYIMAFDLHSRKDGKLMDNAALADLNEQFEGIQETINDFGDTDKYPTDKYANINNALQYAYFSGDGEYLKNLAKACNEKVEEDAALVYSDETLSQFDMFINPAEGDGNVWKESYSEYLEVDGKKIYSNSLAYYYSVMGVMSEEDSLAYAEGLKTAYLQSWPEADPSWWSTLSTAARVWFIIGMVAAGLVVIAAVVVVIIVVKRRNSKALPEYKKQRKIDTVDDKSIDVYDTGLTED